MTTIYLIRHGEAEGNLYCRTHGHYDSLLTPDGHRQMQALEKRFRDIPVDVCWSSDLTRTRPTARAVYVPKGLTLHTDPRFREIYMGVWEDMPFAQMAREYPEALHLYHTDPPRWQVPGSETFDQFTGRFIQALTEVAAANDGKTACIFAHGGIIAAVLYALFFRPQGLPFSEVGRSDNTAVSLLEYEEGRFRLVFRNDNSHLPEGLSTVARQKAPNRQDFWYRPVEPQEAELYIRFRQDAWEHIYGTLEGFDGPGFWQDARQTSGGYANAMVFAMAGDDIAGVLQLNPLREERKGMGYIPFFYLREPYRNRGMGVQLIGQAVSFYRPLGRTALQLSVAPSNAHAIRFYEKYGFVRSGKTKGLFGGLYVMEKDIDLAKYRDDILPGQPPRAERRWFRRGRL